MSQKMPHHDLHCMIALQVLTMYAITIIKIDVGLKQL
jgi:hypothetical protein